MALIEKLQRRIIDLGLLPRIVRFLPKLSILCGILGICWLTLLLPLEGQYRHTYISENALMPSQAYSYFRETEWNILRGYRTQIQVLEEKSSKERNEVVASWFQEFGAKTAFYEDDLHGNTMYGVLHAPRGDGTEAMVLAAPWYNGDGEYNIGGAALATALSRFFSRWPVWSKNIIIVFSDDPEASLRSWVHAYHTSLDLTGGSIESAVVLDYPGSNDFFKYVEIYYAGLNGELPNLDLVNVAVHITEHEGMKVSLNGVSEEEMEKRDYFSKMKTMMVGVKKMALSGVQSCYGNEAFSGWRIQAIVLRARGTDGPFDITTFGRIPEATFRSVNNLLEKFHQSFFFYLLLAPRYFVSIASYLPAAVAFSVSFIVATLDCVLKSGASNTPAFSVHNLSAVIGFTVALLLSFALSKLFSHWQYSSLLVSCNAVIAVLPAIFGGQGIEASHSYQFKSVAFLYLSVVLTSLLVINFALAFGIGLLAFPLILVKAPMTSRQRVKNTILLILSNPFISTLLFVNTFEPQLSGLQLFHRLVQAWQKLGCWTWSVVCIGWLPSWLLVACSGIPMPYQPVGGSSQRLGSSTKKTQ